MSFICRAITCTDDLQSFHFHHAVRSARVKQARLEVNSNLQHVVNSLQRQRRNELEKEHTEPSGLRHPRQCHVRGHAPFPRHCDVDACALHAAGAGYDSACTEQSTAPNATRCDHSCRCARCLPPSRGPHAGRLTPLSCICVQMPSTMINRYRVAGGLEALPPSPNTFARALNTSVGTPVRSKLGPHADSAANTLSTALETESLGHSIDRLGLEPGTRSATTLEDSLSKMERKLNRELSLSNLQQKPSNWETVRKGTLRRRSSMPSITIRKNITKDAEGIDAAGFRPRRASMVAGDVRDVVEAAAACSAAGSASAASLGMTSRPQPLPSIPRAK